jgi:hypothetical protein
MGFTTASTPLTLLQMERVTLSIMLTPLPIVSCIFFTTNWQQDFAVLTTL